MEYPLNSNITRLFLEREREREREKDEEKNER